MVMTAGGEARTYLQRMPRTLRVGIVPGGRTEYVSIQAAIDYANSQGGDWTIEVYPGVYDEGEITHTGAGVTISIVGITGTGIDPYVPGIVEIAPTAEPATAVFVANGVAANLHLSNLYIVAPNANKPCLFVAGSGRINTNNCTLLGVGAGDAAQVRGGVLVMDNSAVITGDIALSLATGTLRMRNSRLQNDPITTAGAFGHTVVIIDCDLAGQNLASAATGATTLDMKGCVNVGTVSNAGTGTFTIRNSQLSTVTATSTGTFVIWGGSLNACGGASASITWKTAGQQYEVIAGMRIQHAVTAAAADTPVPSATAPYTILIHPGIYDPGATITSSTYVFLKGVGPRGAVVISRTSGHILNAAAVTRIQNVTFRLVTPLVGNGMVRDNAVICDIRLTDVNFEVTTLNVSMFCIGLSTISTLVAERCYGVISGGGATSCNFLNVSDVATCLLIDNDYTLNAVNGEIFNSTSTSTVNCRGNRWSGTAAMFNCSAGTFTFDHDALLASATWTNTSTNMVFRNCEISAAVVAGAAAFIRIYNCQYYAISRSGTGNIVDRSPRPAMLHWHLVYNALVANRLVLGGSASSGGSGQIVLRINDNAADGAGVENAADAPGGLDSSFTPARTPRYCRQVSIGNAAGGSAFKATTTIFFGLRATLGNAVPVAAEHHAGFAWDGANFKAVSSDGVAIESTNLATPSTAAQHQLEVWVRGGVGVYFYVDGALVATHSTRVPVNALDFQEYQISDGLGGATTSDITLREGFVQECPA